MPYLHYFEYRWPFLTILLFWQLQLSGQIQMSFCGGLAHSSHFGNEDLEDNYHFTFIQRPTFGLDFIKSKKDLFLKSGVYYQIKGGHSINLKVTPGQQPSKYYAKNEHISIPITFGIRTGYKLMVMPSIGAYAAVLFSANGHLDNKNSPAINNLPGYTMIDLGLVGRLEFEYKIYKKMIIGFRGEIDYGLLDISKVKSLKVKNFFYAHLLYVSVPLESAATN